MSHKKQFLKTKLVGVSFGDVILGQIESLVLGLVGWMPTILGMAVRNILYRCVGMEIQGFCWIQPHVTIVNMRKFKVGKNFGCNTGTYINAIGGIKMGNDVLIGSNVTISSGKHEISGRDSSVFSRPSQPMPITFGSDIWLGAGVSILPGLNIADGTVIGANSVLTRSTEPYSVLVGAPARVVRFR